MTSAEVLFGSIAKPSMPAPTPLPINKPILKKPAWALSLEDMPTGGLISQYGVCEALNDFSLHEYSQEFLKKFEAWVKKSKG